ncbi:MAG TPA: hypothetical protein HA257_06470 [Candidatus Methanoperedenaceae archaeon]|nr:hypothetical protein [Candidatus Methanoperedenaceae archaeon]
MNAFENKVGGEIARLFPSKKSGSVEIGLFRIPLFFDPAFGINRGSVKLRRYLVHMAECGETKGAMVEKTMEKYREFEKLIAASESDELTRKQRVQMLDSYMMKFVEEVGEQIKKIDFRSTLIF